MDLAFHQDGRHLVSVTVADELQTWDAISGVLRGQHSLPISAEPFEIGGVLAAFRPGGRQLTGRCREDRRLVRIWDVGSGKELLNWNESISVWNAPMSGDEEDRLEQGTEERAYFWHLEEAEYCVEHKMKYGTLFHLQRLGDALPPLLQQRRERVLAKMANERK